jgi:glycosyltransferase involved in cell wall biosynthesis
MRIAVLSAARSVHTVRWVNALAARGHEVELYSLSAHKAPYDDFDRSVGINYINGSGAAGYYFGARKLAELLHEFSPDVLSAHYATGYGTMARRCAVRPLLLSVWGADVYDFPEKGAINRRIVCRNLEAADAIASTSEIMAKRVKELCGEKTIYITPFGVDTQIFSPASGVRTGPVTIGTVKALEPKYGIEYLVKAFAMLRSRLTREGKMPEEGIRLVICGDGGRRAALETLAKELGISDCVTFVGKIPHDAVPDAIRGFDIFCSPSVLDSESFGVSAVEAMACGVPVVTSDVDGFREVVSDRETGFIVPRRDQVSLSNRLYELCIDAQLRTLMGAAGRRRVIEKYEWRDCVCAMEEALRLTAENGDKR